MLATRNAFAARVQHPALPTANPRGPPSFPDQPLAPAKNEPSRPLLFASIISDLPPLDAPLAASHFVVPSGDAFERAFPRATLVLFLGIGATVFRVSGDNRHRRVPHVVLLWASDTGARAFPVFDAPEGVLPKTAAPLAAPFLGDPVLEFTLPSACLEERPLSVVAPPFARVLRLAQLGQVQFAVQLVGVIFLGELVTSAKGSDFAGSGGKGRESKEDESECVLHGCLVVIVVVVAVVVVSSFENEDYEILFC